MQRAGAIGLKSVDVGFLLEQQPDGRLVASHHSVGDIAFRGPEIADE
jgi:hypothetical protein